MGGAGGFEERRTGERYKLALPVQLNDGIGITCDISASGIFAVAETRPIFCADGTVSKASPLSTNATNQELRGSGLYAPDMWERPGRVREQFFSLVQDVRSQVFGFSVNDGSLVKDQNSTT